MSALSLSPDPFVPRPPEVKGWCPGALRPMESGDGLIVRMRLTGGIVPAGTLAAIADLSTRFGNGLVDLSQRANLQLRGVREADLPALQDALAALGLLDRSRESEAVRNVIAPPLAGLDPSALVDGGGLVRALDERLVADVRLHALPEKFGFLVDDGGLATLDAIAADIRLVGDADGVLLQVGGDAAGASPLGIIDAEHAVEAAVAIALGFLALRGDDGPRRMRGLIERTGLEALAAAARAQGLPPLRPAVAALDRPGRAALVPGARSYGVVIGAPYGRFTADQVRAIGDAAPAGIRLTPFRAVVLPGAGAERLPALAAAGLVTAAEDPRRAVVACAGSAGCLHGHVDTRETADRLAPLAAALAGADGIGLHISGCPKGCARPAAAPVTLVGRSGLFDIVDDGRASEPPHLSGLDLAAVSAHLAARSGSAS